MRRTAKLLGWRQDAYFGFGVPIPNKYRCVVKNKKYASEVKDGIILWNKNADSLINDFGGVLLYNNIIGPVDKQHIFSGYFHHQYNFDTELKQLKEKHPYINFAMSPEEFYKGIEYNDDSIADITELPVGNWQSRVQVDKFQTLEKLAGLYIVGA